MQTGLIILWSLTKLPSFKKLVGELDEELYSSTALQVQTTAIKPARQILTSSPRLNKLLIILLPHSIYWAFVSLSWSPKIFSTAPAVLAKSLAVTVMLNLIQIFIFMIYCTYWWTGMFNAEHLYLFLKS